MKIKVQRLVEVWVEDTYEVDNLDSDTLQQAVEYDIDSEGNEVLWETLVDRGPYEIYDEKYHLIENTNDISCK